MPELRIVYTEQLIKAIQEIGNILKTDDQDYINKYLHKAMERSFHRNILPQKHLPMIAEILNDLLKYEKPPRKKDVERDWLKILDKLIHFKTDYCSICNDRLHNQGKFPKDYPDKWKLCCKHLDSLQKHNRGISDLGYDKHKQKFEELFIL